MKHRIAICVGMPLRGHAAWRRRRDKLGASADGLWRAAAARLRRPPPAAAEGGLPPSEILMVVRASGLPPLTQPARRGPRYVLLASDRMGGQLRVVVSAHNGRIVHAEPAHDPRFAYQPVRPRGLVPTGARRSMRDAAALRRPN